MVNERLSNVIGAPFAEYVLTQLNLRAARNSTGVGVVPTRSPEEILFLANKLSWAKLTSSVRVVPDEKTSPIVPITEFYKNLGVGEGYASPEDLAKNWVLEAGTSKANGSGIDLRFGLGEDKAYGLGGIEELGYRPMPGLTGITIDTKGTLGSLREATIQFKVWNMNQLNVIEALYFRLGYSMLLEWGHNQFFTNVNKQGGGGTFETNTYGIDPFLPNLRKEVIQQQIASRSFKLSGNYDAMLGVVTNFHWSFNQEGGYDCTVRLVGLGAIIDSLKINLSYKMPTTLAETYKSQQELIADQQARLAELAALDLEKRKREGTGLPPLPSTPINAQEIYTNIYTADLGTSKVPLTADTFLANQALPISYTADTANQNSSTIVDYFYQAERGGAEVNSAFVRELNQKRTGLFLSPVPNIRSNWTLLPVENIPPVTLSAGLLNLAAIRVSQLPVTDPNYRSFQNEKLLGANTFVRAFDRELFTYRSTTFRGATTIGRSSEFGPDDPIYAELTTLSATVEPLTQTLTYTSTVIDPQSKQKIQKPFSITLTYIPGPLTEAVATDKLTRPTRKEFINAFDKWLSSSRKVQIDSIIKEGTNNVKLKGTFSLDIPSKPVALITIEFNNTALVQTVLPSEQLQEVLPQETQDANPGDNGGVDNSAENVQVDPAERFSSALHAMLAATKSQIQYSMYSTTEGVSIVDLSDLTNAFYKDGILEGIFNLKLDTTITEFNLKQYALKGFNSNMMVDNSLFAKGEPGSPSIPKVAFKSLSTGYGIRYTIQDDKGNINNPTYIKFGYLLAFLNSMCLIYDSVQDTDKHPYVYLDFNPETNFCLTNPQHLSVDPFTCMIPFNGTAEDYLKLFPKSIAPNANDSSIFNPSINAVSSYLPEFKNNPYQGKTMEILLNIDFLLEKLGQFTTSNKEHVVNLKGFLDAIVDGINKATGNLNYFRVAYRDDSNTVIIKDDQFVPPAEEEAWMMNTFSEETKYDVPEGVNVPKYGQLPIFGKQSLVRELRFETDMSTNLSNIIAISGQADTSAVNSTDHSAFSWLNRNFKDSYKPKVTNSSLTTSKTNENQTSKEEIKRLVEHDLDQATQFNDHVKSIYYGGRNSKGEENRLAQSKVSFATNYYMNGIANVKSADGITLAAPFIPANINITIDGIAGIVMGNAFTIPEDRLPLSLRGSGGTNKNTKVGFIVVGLTHSIQNNQWLTKIRGQMIRLRDSTTYGITQQLNKIQATFPTTVATLASTTSQDNINTLNLNQSWVGIAFEYIARKESFKSQAYFDVTRFRGGYGSDIFVSIPDTNGNIDISTVTSATTFTQQDAKRTLEYSIAGPYLNGVIAQIGKTKWESLKDTQKAALLSYAYNAGPGALRTWGIVRALEINASANQVAQLIQTGPITAKGVVLEGLRVRRREEAQLYLS